MTNEAQQKIKLTGEGVVYPFNSEEFFETWSLWLQFRREIKKPITGKISEQGQLKKLSRLANGDESKALLIIEQSIENNWRGFFNLKNNANVTKQNTDDELTEALKRRFQY